jgi:hypothetical protein
MVLIHPKITLGLQFQIETTMGCQQGEHVVKKTYGGLNPAFTTTIKSKLHVDLGLFGFPSYVCCSWHPISSCNVKGNQIHV